jgi:hypothetical protein
MVGATFIADMLPLTSEKSNDTSILFSFSR